MKRISVYLSLVLMVVFSACNDQLELEPAQSISENLALSTDANVKAVLIGAYDEFGNGDVFGGNALRNAELLGGNGEIQWVGTFNAPREIFNKSMIAANSDASELWLEAYEAINIANNVLSALEVVVDGDRDRVEGEALFLRATLYFELIRFYAKQYRIGGDNNIPGVPLVLTPTRGITEANQVSRATVQAVYDQIIADLTAASSKLPETNGFFATSHAASAMLARVYLQQGDYSNALAAADAVIQSGLFSLVPNYADAFNQGGNTVEDVFAVQVTSQDGVNNMNLFFSIPDFGGRDGDIDVLDGHLSLYDSTDARLSLFFDGNGGMRSGKWNNQFGNVNLIRVAEMHLVRAECNVRLGSSTGAPALDDYNAIRERAGLAAATEVNLENILFERRLELAHEGFRIHDQRRTQTDISSGIGWDADELIFPIPAREIEANPNLEQNAGY
ncbi:MAG: RagB/SusD family nutrient uptake outer membrane protein [Bacteroidota bacterium]